MCPGPHRLRKENNMALVAKTDFHVVLPTYEVEQYPKGFPKDQLPEDLAPLVGDHIWEDDGADVVSEESTPEEPKDIEHLTVAELKELAAEKGVELAADAKKADIVEALRAADA